MSTASAAAAPAAVRRRFARVGRLVGSGLRGAPATVGLLVVLWAVGLGTRSVVHGPSRGLLRHVAVGVRPLGDGRWWTPLTSLLWARGVSGYVLATLMLVVLAAPAERRLGARRVLVAGVLSQVLGTLLAVGLVRLLALSPGAWARQLERAVLVGPVPFAVGALLAASCTMDTLWRRRLRVGLLTVLVVLALYGGFLHDLASLAAAIVGLALGPLLVGRRARVRRVTGTRREGRVLVSLAVAASAVGPVLAAFSPQAVGPLSVLAGVFTAAPPDAVTVLDVCADPDRLAECTELQAQLRVSGVGPLVLSLLPSLLLLVLAEGLRRGRRSALVGAAALTGLLAVLAAVLGLQAVLSGESVALPGRGGGDVPVVRDLLVPVLGPLAVLALLLATRRFFDVAAPRGTYRSLALTTGGLLVAIAVLYPALGWLVRGGFDRPPGLGALLLDVPRRLVPPGYLVETAPAFLPRSVPATLLFEWTGVVFWAALAVQALLTFVRDPVEVDGADRERARELVRAHGGSSLSWMTTWRGNRYWFTPTGRGVVAYRVQAGVAVSTGDPVGPAGELRAAVVGFAEHAAAQGWAVCLYSVTEEVRAVCAELGWSHLQVAEETAMPLGTLAFTGKKFQDVRSALNKARKDGITAEWVTYPTAPLAITDQITAISEEWVADKGLPEMGFTLGGLDEVDDPEVRCLVAVDADRTVHGVTSWLPVHRDGRVVAWTLDFMRRRTDGFRPSMEFLLASAALLLQEEGAERLSLSGAPLARVPRAGAPADPGGADPPDPAVLERLLDVLGRALEPVYGFRSLLAFKAKFQPEYSPVFLTYPDPAALPAIGNAIGRAYLPDVSLGQGIALVRRLAGRGGR
ncbi:DUF2156 domain-containing protein [Rhodococcus aerolatus]